MLNRTTALGIAWWALSAGESYAQECLHDARETAFQAGRRTEALTAARMINSIQANQPGAGSGVFLRHVELADAPFAAKLQGSSNDTIRRMSLTPETDLLPGWRLTLDRTEGGYWFMVTDTTDPCGFAYISSQRGLIFSAQPLR